MGTVNVTSGTICVDSVTLNRTGNLIEEHFKDTLIDWSSDYVSLYDSLQDLADAMTLDLSYSKKVINYCACDTGYNVLFEMKNGTTYRLHDVCDLINN